MLGFSNTDYFKGKTKDDVSLMVNPDGSYTPEYQKWLDWANKTNGLWEQKKSGQLSQDDFAGQMNDLSKQYGYYWKNNGQDVTDWNQYFNGQQPQTDTQQPKQPQQPNTLANMLGSKEKPINPLWGDYTSQIGASQNNNLYSLMGNKGYY